MSKPKKKAKAKQDFEMELDFTHSRAGLSTHKRNTAEQQRLDDRIRTLDSMRRRSVQLHADEQRELLQQLAVSQASRSQATTPRSPDVRRFELLTPGEARTASRSSPRRGSLQPGFLESDLLAPRPHDPVNIKVSPSRGSSRRGSVQPEPPDSDLFGSTLHDSSDLKGSPPRGCSRRGVLQPDSGLLSPKPHDSSDLRSSASPASSRRRSLQVEPVDFDLLFPGESLNASRATPRRGSVTKETVDPDRLLPKPPTSKESDLLFPSEARSAPRSGTRRGSLQPEAQDPPPTHQPPLPGGSEDGVEIVSACPPGRSTGRPRRPSIVLQNASCQPVLDVSSPTSLSPGRDGAGGTILDMIATVTSSAATARRGRRASVGGPLGQLQEADLLSLRDLSPRRGGGGGGSTAAGVVAEEGEVAVAEEGFVGGGGGVEKPPPSPSLTPRRQRRASVDVGVANLSLLSPPSPTAPSRLAVRRSSVASSQGTPSTPSTPDSKSRDGSSAFTFPSPNGSTHASPARHAKLQLQRCHSSDSLGLGTSGRTHLHPNVAPGNAASPSANPACSKHRRNSSLKLPRVHGGRRKSVVPCTARMVVLHNILQNSASFLATEADD